MAAHANRNLKELKDHRITSIAGGGKGEEGETLGERGWRKRKMETVLRIMISRS